MRRFSIKWFFKAVVWLLIISLLILIIFANLLVQQNHKHVPLTLEKVQTAAYVKRLLMQDNNTLLKKSNESMVLENPLIELGRRDWHDYMAMARDRIRQGPGENGEKVLNTNKSIAELVSRMSLANGFNAYISDLISVNRSLPDIRNKG